MAQPIHRLSLQVSVSEQWAAKAAQTGRSPTELAEAILESIDPADWKGSAVAPAPASQGNLGRQEFRNSSAYSAPAGDASVPQLSGWSKVDFERYLAVATKMPDFFEPLALLAAYVQLGPMPTSAQLQELCRFEYDLIWQKELRASKARLTIQARRMKLPTFFPRAQSSETSRYHPIEPAVYGWLLDWHRANPTSVPEPQEWGPRIERGGKYGEPGEGT